MPTPFSPGQISVSTEPGEVQDSHGHRQTSQAGEAAANPELRRYVQDGLSGAVQRPDGIANGLEVAWERPSQGPELG
jgi:hypothetical protein